MQIDKTERHERDKLINFYISEVESCIGKKDFQRSFFESLKAQWETRKSLSEPQLTSLSRMYQRITS